MLLAVGLFFSLGCGPTLSVTPQQLDGFHHACKQRIKGGYVVQSSKNVGFGAKKPVGSEVVIYGADWCEPCHIAAAYLERRGIPFVELDVDEDEEARRAMFVTLESAGIAGRDTLPVIDVRGTVMTGFNPCVVEAAWAG